MFFGFHEQLNVIHECLIYRITRKQLDIYQHCIIKIIMKICQKNFRVFENSETAQQIEDNNVINDPEANE